MKNICLLLTMAVALSAAGTTQTFTGVITTFAGNGITGSAGDGGPATNAQITHPYGVSLDRAGNVLIADTDNNKIRLVDFSGVISTIAGTGVRAFGGDGGPASSAQINGPQGIAADTYGNVYIADTANHRVRIVSPLSTSAFDGLKITAISRPSAVQGTTVFAMIFGTRLTGATSVNFSGSGVAWVPSICSARYCFPLHPDGATTNSTRRIRLINCRTFGLVYRSDDVELIDCQEEMIIDTFA